MKGFKKKIRTMKKSLKSMAAQIKAFQSKPRPPSPTPKVRRSGFTSSAARRADRIDQPRASSFEPREVISELREPRSRQRRAFTRAIDRTSKTLPPQLQPLPILKRIWTIKSPSTSPDHWGNTTSTIVYTIAFVFIFLCVFCALVLNSLSDFITQASV